MLNVNEYFDGKVKSISFENASAGSASVGVMLPGEYIFSTINPEEMTVITGSLKVLLPTADDWQVFQAGQVFHVAGESKFDVQVVEATAYLCRYLAN
ncbi:MULTISPECIES: pyrimidine/purine nucleoside phosphorylase [unclassified Gilliamella]|uniref:pyrimidine/purine nucleoside phosphorylase n=1 Tax=unclassified Gilliamella TaxID=2685620 RepID=UPI00080ECAAE|nr:MULTISPECIES: pyrimidine/purine nucleoside phosphorylase [Gilliamella]MCX8640977.1 pyrimidine/purine nucleoside phosphorylase [Gilliamella sp. B3835]MCX8707916.1 pyrimidine/purine nucleoside phosphorylase [Gilliamella sp. B3783]MCX8710247.1 pyrimidine/purine nucleoside phosphorylase [Gilliamella sp. B3780]MCX8712465.1 pyrimidine/purine nucleoside phosphorylase [Gilliamella sp. B3468]MCX8714896.1 pyrimidine/purine nucleoside phosphorylase [Gilliamella sp. B3781]